MAGVAGAAGINGRGKRGEKGPPGIQGLMGQPGDRGNDVIEVREGNINNDVFGAYLVVYVILLTAELNAYFVSFLPCFNFIPF